jgi:hypothetical protein
MYRRRDLSETQKSHSTVPRCTRKIHCGGEPPGTFSAAWPSAKATTQQGSTGRIQLMPLWGLQRMRTPGVTVTCGVQKNAERRDCLNQWMHILRLALVGNHGYVHILARLLENDSHPRKRTDLKYEVHRELYCTVHWPCRLSALHINSIWRPGPVRVAWIGRLKALAHAMSCQIGRPLLRLSEQIPSIHNRERAGHRERTRVCVREPHLMSTLSLSLSLSLPSPSKLNSKRPMDPIHVAHSYFQEESEACSTSTPLPPRLPLRIDSPSVILLVCKVLASWCHIRNPPRTAPPVVAWVSPRLCLPVRVPGSSTTTTKNNIRTFNRQISWMSRCRAPVWQTFLLVHASCEGSVQAGENAPASRSSCIDACSSTCASRGAATPTTRGTCTRILRTSYVLTERCWAPNSYQGLACAL